MRMDALLATKLLAPALRPDGIARPRLIARLAEGLAAGRRLTLVSAPPGFGKTTLLRAWVAAADRPAAWLTLDEGDDDPARFLRYLAAALHQADARLGGTVAPHPEPVEGSAARRQADARLEGDLLADTPQAGLIALINDLTATGAELLLILDDYHALRAFPVHDLVAFLLTHGPPGLHLVIGTREDPPLPLARLRARDQVTELREAALRFTTEEAAAFLSQTMRLGLPPAASAALATRTEGWITGLQLAGLALRQRAGEPADGRATAEFVAAFAGDDRFIVDYLMAEVLGRTPAHLRDFLRRTAILDRLSAPLCDALTGRDDAQALLEQLEAANLFVIPLDNRREWYRYHVLFAEVLRLTLAAAERGELHRQAARWYQAHGWGELALRHIRQADDATDTAEATPRRAPGGEALIEPLSEREIEVLRLIAAGSSNAEIGEKLYIAVGTVKRHINNIYGKLGVESRTQAIARARELGLLA